MVQLCLRLQIEFRERRTGSMIPRETASRILTSRRTARPPRQEMVLQSALDADPRERHLPGLRHATWHPASSTKTVDDNIVGGDDRLSFRDCGNPDTDRGGARAGQDVTSGFSTNASVCVTMDCSARKPGKTPPDDDDFDDERCGRSRFRRSVSSRLTPSPSVGAHAQSRVRCRRWSRRHSPRVPAKR